MRRYGKAHGMRHVGNMNQCSVAGLWGVYQRRYVDEMVGGHFLRQFRLGPTCGRDKRFNKMKDE